MEKITHTTAGMSMLTQWALAVQHLLAVFSGTIIVPLLTGLPVCTTLLFSGISTLIFQFFTRGKIPLFYSCSFVFIGAFAIIQKAAVEHGLTPTMGLCYASFGVFISGLVYIVIGQLVRRVSYETITRFCPPVLSGSYIMALGITLAGICIWSISFDWEIGVTSIVAAIIAQHFFKGKMKLMPLNIGVLAAVILSAVEGKIDTSHIEGQQWIQIPFDRKFMAFTIFENFDIELLLLSIATFVPLVLVSVVEHIADLLAVSRTTRIDYIRNIGLPRTLSANGISTMVGAMFGAPPSSSFSQTTGLLMVNKVCSPTLIRMAGIIMIALSFSPKLSTIVASVPSAAIGGVTLILYGMIMVVGLRTFIDAKVDFSDTRNLVIMSTVLVLTVGIKYVMNDTVVIFGITFSALTVAGILGTLMNLILKPSKNDKHTVDNEKAS